MTTPTTWSDVPPSEPGHYWVRLTGRPFVDELDDQLLWESVAPCIDKCQFGPRVLSAEETVQQAAEVERLRQWKESAMSVLAEWDNVWERLGKPGTIGSSKAMESLKEVEWLRAELAEIHRAWGMKGGTS